MTPTPIHPHGRPAPLGHYTPGVKFGECLYISGQLPGQGEPSAQNLPLEMQARRALASLLEVLKAAGGTPEDLLKVTVYLVGVEHWPAFNAVYADVLRDARPARSVVPVPALHHGYLVEIDAVAAVRPTDPSTRSPTGSA